MPKQDSWRNRIVGSGDEEPEQLLANPLNYRIHPKEQQDALSHVMDTVGWVDRVIVNRTTSTVIDGHLRVALAISRGEPTVPVEYVELTEDEEALVLATFDWITGQAGIDREKLKDILGQIDVGAMDGVNKEIAQKLIKQIRQDQYIEELDTIKFPEYDESIADEVEWHECPECNHKWPK